MPRLRLSLAMLSLALGLSTTSAAHSKADAAAAAQLGKTLSCTGAELAGNADGSIPPASGKWLGTPPHLDYSLHLGQHPVDPYPDDEPLFEINAGNVDQHAERLTPGQLAMFRHYPDSFRMLVYPGRRDFRVPDKVCEFARFNALNAELADEGLGFTGAIKGAPPFPLPQHAMEVLNNMLLPLRAFSDITTRDIADVDSAGNITWGRQYNSLLAHYLLPEQQGKVFDGLMTYALTHTLLPERERGLQTVSREPVNFAFGKRLAWQYDPGTRKVRQLPSYGYDHPMSGSNGKMTIDQDRLMNGDPGRYQWTLHGRREIYTPANSYRLHSADVRYADLLQPQHPSAELMRYELRRVWVLEGKLKPGHHHLFARRVLYIDEDSWQATLGDYHDNTGKLWQHAALHLYYAFDTSAWHAGNSFFHDLHSGSYIAFNLFQERPQGPILNIDGLSPDQYTPAALRARGN